MTKSERIVRSTIFVLAAGLLVAGTPPRNATAASVYARHETVDGVKLFYREAGDPSNPTIVLLHGFPSSSFEFHALIPLLGERFHVVAPDYPGMGYSETPGAGGLAPTFDNLAVVTFQLLAQLGLSSVILYMHDFGGPVGMRLAVAHPDLIRGMVFQNRTISLSGYNPARLQVFHRMGGPETPAKLAEAEESASETRDKFLHQTGAHDTKALNPDDWAVDAYAFGIPDSRRYMARLLMNIETNTQHYAEWGEFLRTKQPKT
jgi:pimeloyl-ACP methyl ester carboxylesterase